MLAALVICCLAPQTPEPAPSLTLLPPAEVQLDGWLGARVEASRTQWLDKVDLAPRIEPFAQRPAKQAWAGEHLGKWLHAASIAWAGSGDPLLRTRLDAAVTALLKAQDSDGYLGAYLPEQRFQLLPDADWDVWTIKYCLLGLLAYHEATHDPRALEACVRGADRLIAEFGTGKRSILSAGTHVGMAATSVLEPIARLYRVTKESRYLDFARTIVRAWDEPGGPRIATTLREDGRVAQVANGKAYEMLSNLVGLCELARATGDRSLLDPALAAWRDIVEHELFPTGSASRHEHFVGGGRIPSTQPNNLGETCVTVTWLQLNAQLLEITGEARFAREIERSAWNHLAAAQRPDGAAWCYYTSLRGNKPYDSDITCCSSSGPRGLAMLSQRAVMVGADGALVIALPESSHGTATLSGKRVGFRVISGIPHSGHLRVEFDGELPASFGVRLRVSDWGVPATLRAAGEERRVTEAGWCEVAPRGWQRGEGIDLELHCAGRVVNDAADPTRIAVAHGPFVLALDSLVDGQRPTPCVLRGVPTLLGGTSLRFHVGLGGEDGASGLTLLPFAEAGVGGGDYRVWFDSGAEIDLLATIAENRSRAGNVDGSIIDGDRDSFVVTYDGKASASDTFSIHLAEPGEVRRVRFAHGHSFHDGGWFDCSGGRPVVELRATEGGAWSRVGELGDYPATTATDARRLLDGQAFELVLARAVTAVEIRVRGVPAHGDSSKQAFASCAELSAFR